MKNSYNRAGSGYSRSKNFRSNKPRFPGKNKKIYSYKWSETDLIKSIEYSKNATTAKKDDEYIPVNTFETFTIHEQLKKNIKRRNYISPTPIQDQSIPHILAGKDLIGIANTGTGKTAAFLIPLINRVHISDNQKVLIVAPTRELAEQIEKAFRGFSQNMGMYSTLVIGGKSMHTQIKDLKRNPQFVIGTPGRIKDMVKRNILDLSEFNNVVLDEADRMVDIGFIKEIKFFISLLPKNRQSLFFSATISPKVKDIIASFVRNPVTVSVKKQDTNLNIRQEVVRIPNNKKKIDQLHYLLTQKSFEKVIVFGNTKWGVQKLADELIKRGFKAAAIHGDKRQSQRRRILENFKRDEIKILLATDVAARGLDINNVSHVINYEIPDTYDDYVHRIGRTGRANKNGIALTFISN